MGQSLPVVFKNCDTPQVKTGPRGNRHYCLRMSASMTINTRCGSIQPPICEASLWGLYSIMIGTDLLGPTDRNYRAGSGAAVEAVKPG